MGKGKAFNGMAAVLAAVGSLLVVGPAFAAYNWNDVYNEMEAENYFPEGAIIIYHKNAEVYRKGFGNWATYNSTQLGNLPAVNVASLSKTFSAVVAMRVIEDPNVGMSLDSKVKDFITNAETLNPDGHYDVMTIRNLMSMTTGQDYFLPFPTNLLTCVNNPLFSFNTCGQNMVKHDAVGGIAPGQKFAYSSAPWQILSLALTRAVNSAYGTNLTFQQVVAKYLTGPTACNFTKTTLKQPNNAWPAGGFETDLVDGGKLAEAILSRSCNGGFTVLSAASRVQMELDHIHNYYAICTQPNCDPADNGADYVTNPAPDDRGYGLGLFLNNQTELDDGTPVTAAVTPVWIGIGARGATLFYSPDGDWAAYLHLNNSGLDASAKGLALAERLVPLIKVQADANP
jgi:CubicO group peptidase (beta-lactamase class C family)